MTRRRALWIFGAFVVALLLVAIFTRGRGYTARGNPSAIESKVMLAARRWATPAAVRKLVNPVSATKDIVYEGMAHWADHCASCHGNDGRGRTEIGRNIYPPAPDMRESRTQSLTDGELFYIIEHGVPFTAMPAWGTGTTSGEEDSWDLVRFIRYLPQLTESEEREMEKLNPKSAAQSEEERRINDFLKGKGGQ